MPTGYTSGVADGSITTLRQYALTCARGMGALITMRDDPMDAPIPPRLEPSTSYYDGEIARRQSELAHLRALAGADLDAAEAADREETNRSRAEQRDDRAAQRRRYDTMLEAVRAWTCGADGLRDFMLSQLSQSIDFDCGGEPDYLQPIEPRDPSAWRDAKVAEAERWLASCRKHRAEEIARTEARNEWLTELWTALPAEAEAA